MSLNCRKCKLIPPEMVTNIADSDYTPLLAKKTCFSLKKIYLSLEKNFFVNLLRKSIAECLGTSLYVFFGLTSLTNFIGNEHPHLPTVALAFGFSFAGISGALQHLSGGHLNPAITLGVFIAGGINVLSFTLYVVSQLLGGIIGALFIMVYQSEFSVSQNMTTTEDISVLYYGSSLVLHGINPGIAIVVEMLLTMTFVTVFINTSMEKKELIGTSPALSGLTLAAGILAGYKLTGGSLNTARSFGPAVLSTDSRVWQDHYVYWIGPLLGGGLAGVLHRFVFSSKALLLCNKTTENGVK